MIFLNIDLTRQILSIYSCCYHFYQTAAHITDSLETIGIACRIIVISDT